MDTTKEIWEEYHSALYSFIQSRVSDKTIAEDILQEVFIKIHARIDTLIDSSKTRSWIYQITRNAIIDNYRTHKTFARLPDRLATTETKASDDARQEAAYWLFPLIEELPSRYKQALILHEIEGLAQKDVASTLGLSLSGAKSRVQRGREILKNLMFYY
ncbi:MAG: RNA polymerase sigma factor SigZ [bacterium]|nr:RNA polymerase sigma factor SigZ [bacterium]